MAVPRYPCRSCGQATEGEDTYVVCSECLEALELQLTGPSSAGRVLDAGSTREPPTIPLAPDEIEARLRKLLDDW